MLVNDKHAFPKRLKSVNRDHLPTKKEYINLNKMYAHIVVA